MGVFRAHSPSSLQHVYQAKAGICRSRLHTGCMAAFPSVRFSLYVKGPSQVPFSGLNGASSSPCGHQVKMRDASGHGIGRA